MSIHVIGVVALALVFVIGTLKPVNIGALALIAAFLIGKLVVHEDAAKILSGFPPDLFVLLVGVTYLFGLAAVNGTLEWLIERAVGLLGDRPALVPWLIFCFSAVPTTAGALGPAGVAMLAPVCLGLGRRYGIDRRMSALMVMHGSCLGNFSPLNGLAIIVQQAAKSNGFSVSAVDLFFGNAAYNLGLAIVIYFVFGGRKLRRESRTRPASLAVAPGSGAGVAAPARASAAVGGGGASVVGEDNIPPVAGGSDVASDGPTATKARLRLDQAATLVVLVGVAVGALAFDVEIGFLALIAAALLHTLFPVRFAQADTKIVWSVVLLICGIVTFVTALQRYGTVEVVGEGIGDLGQPLLTAFLLCLVAAVTSAFASSAGLLGVLIPLAVPFLAQGDVGSTALIVSLAVCATVVDSTPFSSVGALTLANAPEMERSKLFRTMLTWGLSMAVTAPVLTWLLFILPSAP
ncbi:SLC13 family permease [Streptomyces sp. NPDC050509]|uniref:SLC13 family permease n=1 Tax=Streptomyces sp. NPDC050509 TaxID=3365620 RepID=UPI0037B8964F